MTKLDVYSATGEKTGTMQLAPDVFNAPVSPTAVHQVIVSIQANSRHSIAHTKSRGFIRGGGRKPWRQKGTGNARAGSIRSPLWRGGGIIFGPTSQRNFSKKIPKTLFRKSLISVLSDRIKHGLIFIVDDLSVTAGKTKEFSAKIANLRGKLGIKTEKMMIVVPKITENLDRSSKNLQNTQVVSVDSVSPLNLLSSPVTIILKEAITLLERRLLKKSD